MRKAKDKEQLKELRKQYPHDPIEMDGPDKDRTWVYLPWREEPRPKIKKAARYSNPNHHGHANKKDND